MDKYAHMLRLVVIGNHPIVPARPLEVDAADSLAVLEQLVVQFHPLYARGRRVQW